MPGVATFRFYEELNDFLAPARRKVAFEHSFDGRPGIKDVIEAIGVPHTEIDLILVNGESVGFDYSVEDGDRVAVYPVFEGIDITNVTRLRRFPLRDTKFILDVHLGKLARYLRMLGFDCLYRNDYDDPEIIRLSRAEGRTILTHDSGILKVGAVTHGYWIRSQYPKEQTREVLRRFDLRSMVKPFTLCTECNGKIEPVAKEEVFGQLEELTRKHYHEFHRCTACGRVYWKGSHYEKIQGLVDSFCSE